MAIRKRCKKTEIRGQRRQTPITRSLKHGCKQRRSKAKNIREVRDILQGDTISICCLSHSLAKRHGRWRKHIMMLGPSQAPRRCAHDGPEGKLRILSVESLKSPGKR